MGVRVKIKIISRSTGKQVITSALVNSGFESDKPQLLIPRKLAEELGLWPPTVTTSMEYKTTAGPVYLITISDELEVYIVTHDKEKGPFVCDAVISTIEDEVLINDQLGELLGIIILGLSSGKWKFIDDPPDKIRTSESPQYWR